MKKVILISGKMQSGKNQFADYLGKELKSKGLKVSNDLFARSLKDGCKDDFKKLAIVLEQIASEIKNKFDTFVDRKEYLFNASIVNDINSSLSKLLIRDENWYENKTEITRNILQLYGTEIFRNRVDQDWWVKQVKNRAIASNDDIIIITDARFPNEISGILCDDYETVVVRIERNINTQEQIASHDSEIALDNWESWDYIVENNGTLEDLKDSAVAVAQNIIEIVEDNYDGLFTRMKHKESFNIS